MILRKAPPFSALLASFLLFESVFAAEEKGFVTLFNGKDLTGFRIAIRGPQQDNEMLKTFTVKNGVIEVSGKPQGYLYTDKCYKNYVMRFDWKILRDGAAGVLVHIATPQVVWPKCVVILAARGDYGKTFIRGRGLRGSFTADDAVRTKAIKGNGWNTTEITSKNGELTCKINGVEVGAGRGDLTEGQIGWTSEEAVFQLKNISIKID